MGRKFYLLYKGTGRIGTEEIYFIIKMSANFAAEIVIPWRQQAQCHR